MPVKKSNDTIGNRTRDLPACSVVPQPTAPPRAPTVKTAFIVFRKLSTIHILIYNFSFIWHEHPLVRAWINAKKKPITFLNIRPSVRPSAYISVDPKWHNSAKFYTVEFSECLLWNTKLGYSRTQISALHMQTEGRFIATGHTKSPPKRSLRVKWYLLLRPHHNLTSLNTSPIFFIPSMCYSSFINNFIPCVFRYLVADQNRYCRLHNYSPDCMWQCHLALWAFQDEVSYVNVNRLA